MLTCDLLQLSEQSREKVDKFEIDGEKLLEASAAEMIIVFGSQDGSALVLALAYICSGMRITVWITRKQISSAIYRHFLLFEGAELQIFRLTRFLLVCDYGYWI